MRHGPSFCFALGAATVVLAGPPQCLWAQAASLVAGRELHTHLSGALAWGGRGVISLENDHSADPLLYLIDRDGKREEIRLNVPGASLLNIYNIAGGADGAVVVEGSAYSADSKATTIMAWISPDRSQQVVTRIWPYAPRSIAIAPDATVWTVGDLKTEDNLGVSAVNMLRHWDRSKGLLGSWVVSGTAVSRNRTEASMGSHLMASPDRIGWLTNGGEYIELDSGGKEIQRYPLVPGVASDDLGICGAALSEDNELLVCITASVMRPPGPWRILLLDRRTRTWRTLLPDQPAWSRLLGFDGQIPVMVSAYGEQGVLRWYERRTPRPAGAK